MRGSAVACAVLVVALGAMGCVGGGETVDPSLIGLFHRPDGAAQNLEIAEDRTFRWAYNQCDLRANETGEWRPKGQGVLLLPADGEDEIMLAGTVVPRIEVAPGDVPDEIRLTPIGEDGPTEPRTWTAGGLCTDCSGGLVPTGEPTPCDDPWLGP